MNTRSVVYREVGGFRYHEARSHKGDRSPLLFIHGASSQGSHFGPLITYFANEAHGYAPDMRGRHPFEHGRVQLPNISDHIAHTVAFIERVILADHPDTLPTLVGHSMGGLIAQGVAALGLAKRVVLVASTPPKGIPFPLRRTNLRPLAERVAAAVYQHIMHGEPIGKTLILQRVVGDAGKNRDLFRTLRGDTAQLPWESPRALLDLALSRVVVDPKAVKVPVLVVIPELDHLVPPKVGHALAKFYHAEELLLPKLGHLCIAESGWRSMASQIQKWMREERIAVAA